MSNSIKDTICKRKSVRTFDGRKITAEDRSKLEEIIRTADGLRRLTRSSLCPIRRTISSLTKGRNNGY